ncbi:hypothetical protein GR184_11400 [Bacillus sp. BGMRC0062]|nr:hypothetical protein [Bacillus sp. BGMRC0062]
MARQVVLGGEISPRGVLGGRTWLDLAVLTAAIVAGVASVYTVGGGTWISFIVMALLFTAGVVCTSPSPLWFNGYSLVGMFAQWVARKVRRATGQHTFLPAHAREAWAEEQRAADHANPQISAAKERRRAVARARRWGLAAPESAVKKPTGRKKQRSRSKAQTTKEGSSAASPRQTRRVPNAPMFVGSVRWFELETSAGKMVIFKHMDRPRKTNKAKTYFSVILECVGAPGGVMRDYEADRPYMGFGKFLSKLASRQSLAATHQEISRSLPVDMTEHTEWAVENVSGGAPKIALESYEELISQVGAAAEQHRTFYVLNIPQTAAFRRRAGLYGTGDEADARVIFEEIRRAAAWARNLGAVDSVSALDESRAAALIRSLQDPSYDIDDTLSYLPGREHELLGLGDCWQHLDWSESTNHTTVRNAAGQWLHRTGWIPADGFPAAEMGVRALKGLVTAESEQSFIRTITLTTNLLDAKEARRLGRADLTSDTAAKKRKVRKGQIDDGSSDVKLSSSARRMQDLAPASGHHGAHYGLFLTVSAPDTHGLEVACQAMEARASGCGIDRIDWLRDQQDTAFAATLPLGRGLSA